MLFFLPTFFFFLQPLFSLATRCDNICCLVYFWGLLGANWRLYPKSQSYNLLPCLNSTADLLATRPVCFRWSQSVELSAKYLHKNPTTSRYYWIAWYFSRWLGVHDILSQTQMNGKGIESGSKLSDSFKLFNNTNPCLCMTWLLFLLHQC